METRIVHPKVVERKANPMKYVRDDAARLIIDELQKFKKKIPKRGLNNVTKEPEWFSKSFDWKWKGEPTLRDRMTKLKWSTPYLPPQMVVMGITSEQFNKEAAKSLMIECLELLNNLHNNLDSVTVVPAEQISQWKEMIWKKKRYLMIVAKMLGMIIES